MRIEIKNIGKIREARVDLSSVAVLAGENNSGKSTVGKVLYSIYRALKGGEDLAGVLTEDFDGLLRFGSEGGEINLEGNLSCRIKIDDDGKMEIGKLKKANFHMAYVDDPNILDFKVGAPYLSELLNKRRLDLLYMLEHARAGGQAYINERLEKLLSGDLLVRDGRFYYSKNDGLSMQNTSSGLKMFLILQGLFKNGWLGANSILIFDEPEVHLHPEWQLIFAKVCMDILKAFDLRILVNTHSPYLVNAFEVYAANEGLGARFYLTENSEDFADIVDVTTDIDRIYKELAQPFSKLEVEAYE